MNCRKHSLSYLSIIINNLVYINTINVCIIQMDVIDLILSSVVDRWISTIKNKSYLFNISWFVLDQCFPKLAI